MSRCLLAAAMATGPLSDIGLVIAAAFFVGSMWYVGLFLELVAEHRRIARRLAL